MFYRPSGLRHVKYLIPGSDSDPTRVPVPCPLKPSTFCLLPTPTVPNTSPPPPPYSGSTSLPSTDLPLRPVSLPPSPHVFFRRGARVAALSPRRPPARRRIRAAGQHGLRVRRGGGCRSRTEEGAPATPQGNAPAPASTISSAFGHTRHGQ